MMIKTESGENFILTVADNSVRIQRGAGEGRVVSLSDLTVGKSATIRFFNLDANCKNESDIESILITPPITEILA